MSAILIMHTVGPPQEAYGQAAAALDSRGLQFIPELQVGFVEPQLTVHFDHTNEVHYYIGVENILGWLDDIEASVRANPI